MRYLKTESTYILGNFTTGDTVTVTIYRLSDDTKVVDAATCSEIGATGRFKYLFSQSVTTKTEYLWIMTNGTEEQQGKIILGGYPDDIKAQTDKMNFVETDIKATLDGEKVVLTDETEARVADVVLDEPLSEHISSGSLGEKIYGIRSRSPRSPWTKKDLDKLFSVLDEILKSFDSLPTVQKFQRLSDSIQSSSHELQNDLASLQSILDHHFKSDEKLLKSSSVLQSSLLKLSSDVSSLVREFSTLVNSTDSSFAHLIQSTDFIRSSLSKSFSLAQKEHSRSFEKLHSNLSELSQNFPVIIQRLESLQNNLNSVIKNESATSRDLHSTLQQFFVLSHDIENSLEKLHSLLKAAFISNLPTDTIVSLLLDDLRSPNDISEFLTLLDNSDDQQHQPSLPTSPTKQSFIPKKNRINNNELKEVSHG